MEAEFDNDLAEISLTFDRPVQCSFTLIASVRVAAGRALGEVREHRSQISNVGNTIVFDTQPAGATFVLDDLLTIDAINDLSAQGDGGLFPGVTNLPLPFP